MRLYILQILFSFSFTLRLQFVLTINKPTDAINAHVFITQVQNPSCFIGFPVLSVNLSFEITIPVFRFLPLRILLFTVTVTFLSLSSQFHKTEREPQLPVLKHKINVTRQLFSPWVRSVIGTAKLAVNVISPTSASHM